MKIIQITDLHIGLPGETTFGVNVRRNFRFILQAARQAHPDQLVLTGDFCFRDGQRPIYEWIKEQLAGFPCPVYLIPGNHDDTPLMQDVFNLPSTFFITQWQDWKVCFLDTQPGTLAADQMTWLAKQLQPPSDQLLIFMHHPPLPSGVPYMDNNHALQNQAEVQQLFQSFTCKCYVFSGHYHVERSIHQGNIHSYITPSCFFQIDPNFDHFQVDHRRIAYREIEITDAGLQTSVRYFDGFLAE